MYINIQFAGIYPPKEPLHKSWSFNPKTSNIKSFEIKFRSKVKYFRPQNKQLLLSQTVTLYACVNAECK